MNRLPGLENIHPPMPMLADEEFALEVATQLVNILNIDEFYWCGEELQEKILQLQCMLREGQQVDGSLIRKLHQKYGMWDISDLAEHCGHVGPKVAKEILENSIRAWRERYGITAPQG